MSTKRPHRNGTASLASLPADAALDAYFLELRCKLLDVAAMLDRISRGPNAAAVADDHRLAKVLQALEVLHDESRGRAEMIQQLFSLEYDPNWARPTPR